MGWLAQIAGPLIGGALGNHAANSAQDAQTRASEAAIAEQRRQYDQSRQDQQPYMQYGQGQLGGLQALANGNYSGFMNSPDYLFARDQGLQAAKQHASAVGNYNSGGFAGDLAKLASGYATQNLGNYRGSLQWGANLGQSAASGVGQLGANAASNIGSAYGNIGQAGAQGAYDRANNWGNTLNGLAGLAGSYFGGH